jgi:hypothetical protein
MPVFEITAPDGRKFRVNAPEGATREQALEKVQASYKPRGPVQEIDVDPTTGMSGTDKFLSGVGKGMTDVARGIGQAVGLVSREDVDEVKKRDAPLMNTGAGFGGALVGNVAAMLPTALIPGAGTLGGAAAIGAAQGALAPVGTEDSRLANTALGAAGGVAGNAAARGLARVAQPIKPSVDVQKLVSEGVIPTPGQAAGANSFVGRVEQKLTSLPLIGDVIKKGRDRATEELNLAAIARALPKSEQGTITKAGRAAIDKADEVLGSAYDKVYSGITVKPDSQFLREVVSIKNNQDLALPPELQERFGELIKTQVLARVKGDEIPGLVAQRVDSQLGALARRYTTDMDADKRVLGLAIREAQKSFKGLVERNAGPEIAGTIKDLNRNYANLLRVERAASMQGAKDGVFSADQLSSAVRALDKSSNKGQFAKGQAMMQDLSEAGKATMGGTVPNSGSADRAFMGMLATGGLGATDSLMGGPGALSLLAASPLLYSRAGSRYMLGDFAGQAATADAIRSTAPYAGLLGRSALLGQ